jgi:single-stranded DNA-binding protein
MTADETVEVQVFVPEGMKNNIKEYLHIGDLVGIKGKLKQDSINHNTIVLADKISFLSKASDEAPDDSEDINE